ncbi:MAG TPA: AAA family ATPase [Steroidobacteraceae bacterium]|jgi:general secretion pathway protein A
MYLSFFGLNEKPFAITPDPRYLYLSQRHAEALAHLLYGINEAGGFVQLTGEVGTGKTTIVRKLLAQTPKDAEIALILNPRMTAPEFLLTICEEIGIGVPDSATGSRKDLVDILNQYLLRAHAGGRRVVVVVDEAQNLAPEVLEQVRLLTNLETNTQKLLQIILIGQPELRELLGRNELRQLAQRVTGRYHLNPLSLEETAAYVRHRLRVAGATTDIFTGPALREVYRLSAGVPRVINIISDRALLGAYSLDRHRVTSNLVRHAAAEVFGKRFTPYWMPWAATGATAIILALAAVALLEFKPWQSMAASGQTAVAAAHGASAGAGTPGTGATAGAGTALGKPADTSATLAAGLPAGNPPGPGATPTTAGGATVPTAFHPGTGSTLTQTVKDLLVKYAPNTDTDSAFGTLFGLWGLKYAKGSVDACTQATKQGLECLTQRGSFGQLRLYNRPAILLLSDDAGGSHQVVLKGLDDELAHLEVAGTRTDVSIADLSRYWLGDFVMLWRPATAQVKSLSEGMRGNEVKWLRESLQHLHGDHSDTPASDVFDSDLGRLVRDFQRDHRLTVDGIAGVQTQIVLATAVASPDTPLLYVANTHGS